MTAPISDTDTQPDPAPDAIELDEPSLYGNRELSWVEFNDRVLQIAEDERVALLERLKFLAIYTSNLDEFFMVRVAGLHEQVEAGIDARGADGRSPAEVIEGIRERVSEQAGRVGRALSGDVLPALAERGIRVLDLDEVGAEGRKHLTERFRRQIFPVLTPLAVGLGRPFPYMSNLSLSLAVLLRDPVNGQETFARVKVPKEMMDRFLEVPGLEGSAFVPMEQVIADQLDALFPGIEILEAGCFRVTRDADFTVSDDAEDLLQAVETELRRRRFGEVVRLEISADVPTRLRRLLIEALEVDARDVYEVAGLLDLTDLWQIVGVSGHSDLRDKPYARVVQARLQGDDDEPVDIFKAMRDRDILVHHPYDSWGNSVGRFVEQAVNDPDVLAIKQTVYRTSGDTPLVPALIRAAEAGKQSVCMVELKARFDERANVQWAQKLEESGVHVTYGIPALKTHAKLLLVVRREGDGVRHYCHLGTGNYHPKTARLYTDFGLFTCDEQIGADMADLFNFLTGYARPRRFRKLLVAPNFLRDGVLAEIDKTIEHHREHGTGRIRMKMNSLVDPRSIQALYRASQAGVPVEINTRGICCLRPGVDGVSENIEVVSIVGRLLEHSRIYAFERGGDAAVYMGSADLMPRNLDRRVEQLVPVEDAGLRADLIDVLDRAAADNTNAWELGADWTWRRREPAEGEELRNLQSELMELHTARADEAKKKAAAG